MQPDTSNLYPTPLQPVNRPGGLTFTIERHHCEAHLAVGGALDLATMDSLGDAATALLRPPVRAMLLDLDAVSFFGAAGITALININNAAAAAKIRLVLTGVSPQIRHVLNLTGTTGLIPIARTRNRAATTAQSPEPADRPADTNLNHPHLAQAA